ncbi:MAG: hypothetical protein FD152_2032 [Xanthobacteraceae bacterium]|nr:MAG: hypothetical protein FD152_2032 [Xanthobacteraceae bacterium]
MMQDLPTASPERRKRPADAADQMVSALGLPGDMSDSQAFSILRQRFPQTALCERVAAVARWRMGS